MANKGGNQRLKADNGDGAGGGSVFEADKLKHQHADIVEKREQNQRLPALARDAPQIAAAYRQHHQRGNDQPHLHHHHGIHHAVGVFGGDKGAAPDKQGGDLVEHGRRREKAFQAA
jgi:hypothetical protein